MKKISRILLCLFMAVFAAAVFSGCGKDYRAEELVSSNDENGWLCTFRLLDGSYANAFRINSGRIKIVSSVGAGEMTVYVTGGGKNVSFDGRNAEERIYSSDFGNEGDVLYVTAKCSNARDGRIRVIWLADDDDGETESMAE